MLSDLLFRLRALVRRNAVEDELDEELGFHVEREADKLVARGLSRAQAMRQARLALGGVDQTKEDCRDARGVRAIETVFQDLRYGVRTARRSPIFSITAIVTLALSTAALATVFTLGDGLFFRPLPVDNPGELVVAQSTRGGPNTEGLVSYPDYVTFRDGARTLATLAAAYPTAPLFVTANGTAKEVNGAVVSANFFPMLALKPALGRFFQPSEDEVADRDRVAVISHSFWTHWLAASPDAVGRTIRINGVDFSVVGVMPASFVGLRASPIEIYIPAMMLRVGYRWCDDSLSPTCTILEMFGRLSPGRTAADATAELQTLLPAAWRNAPRGQNSGVIVRPSRGATNSETERRLVRILAGVAVVLLLVSCANLAGLLGAQASARASEFGVRMSLGAGPRRLVRQLMTESILLATVGGLAGIGLSRVFIGVVGSLFYSMDDEGHPRAYDFSLTPTTIVVALLSAVAAGCVFSLIPAIKAARRSGIEGKQRSITAPWSSGAWLLRVQAAVAVALVAVAALLGSSADHMMSGAGFEPSRIALMRLRPRLMKYTPPQAQRFQRDVVQRLTAMAGVESVSMVGVGAVLGGGGVRVGLPGWAADQRLQAGYNEIGPRYFETLRTAMVAGREFDDHDTTQSARVAVVNETLARQLFPDRSALGSAIVLRNNPHEIVGVVRDVKLESRSEPTQPLVFTPFWQNPGQIDARYCIRVVGDPAAMLPALMREVNRVDPEVPIAEAITLPIQLAGWGRQVRMGAAIIGYAAVLSVVLTAIGLYGTLAFGVARRTKEIGVRMALGAARPTVLGLVVREGMLVVLTGAALGLGAAVAGTRLVTHLLYGSAAADWLFYMAAAALVSFIGLLASLLPARRAAAVEPLVALRQE